MRPNVKRSPRLDFAFGNETVGTEAAAAAQLLRVDALNLFCSQTHTINVTIANTGALDVDRLYVATGRSSCASFLRAADDTPIGAQASEGGGGKQGDKGAHVTLLDERLGVGERRL